MPPMQLVDLDALDLNSLQLGPDEIRAVNPHRHEMELLTGIIRFAPEEGFIVGELQLAEDAFWVRGHIPGRPIFPGVLMVEAAAQLCSYYWRATFDQPDRFFGFGGIRDTRFRGTVTPGERLIIAGKVVNLRPRRAIFDTQGFVDGTMVFESQIIGMPV
ncbi:MAG: 3-hydroxyacyl-ACP dehydratase FabZ family protein [Planctomycetota bacterium]